MGLVFSKFNFFINKIFQGRKSVRKKSTFLRTFTFSGDPTIGEPPVIVNFIFKSNPPMLISPEQYYVWWWWWRAARMSLPYWTLFFYYGKKSHIEMTIFHILKIANTDDWQKFYSNGKSVYIIKQLISVCIFRI